MVGAAFGPSKGDADVLDLFERMPLRLEIFDGFGPIKRRIADLETLHHILAEVPFL